MVSYCEHGNELPSYLKAGEFIDQPNDFQFVTRTLLRLVCLLISNTFLMESYLVQNSEARFIFLRDVIQS